ncbi:hypothetical protein [Shewanella insulae]|uniref:hypothetical protein n=1 Tax=Shewanella insulae TaxID=2681496 RepID=UPI002481982C|nr:hypothetical protein [Shewanella insulae]
MADYLISYSFESPTPLNGRPGTKANKTRLENTLSASVIVNARGLTLAKQKVIARGKQNGVRRLKILSAELLL